MPGRVSPSDVTENFDTGLSDSQIQGWIDTATLLVDDVADADGTIGSTRLEKIELAMTRHFAHAQDPRTESEQVADSQATYQGDTGMHLDATHYGQQAKMLDPTGALADAGKEQVTIHVPDSRGIDDPGPSL